MRVCESEEPARPLVGRGDFQIFVDHFGRFRRQARVSARAAAAAMRVEFFRF
jgi:hypothetical protein